MIQRHVDEPVGHGGGWSPQRLPLCCLITGRVGAWHVHRAKRVRVIGADLTIRLGSTRAQRARSWGTKALDGQEQLITVKHAQSKGSEVRGGTTAPNVDDPAAAGWARSWVLCRSLASRRQAPPAHAGGAR